MRLRDRFIIYVVVIAVVGLGATWLLYNSLTGPLSTPNPYDFATFLVVIGGAAVALVVQEVAGRVEIAKFRRSWTEDLRELVAEFSANLAEYDAAAAPVHIDVTRRVIKSGTKALMMLTGSGLTATNDAHSKLEAAVVAAFASRNIKIENDIIKSSRPALKEGWLQAVKEIR